jgi:integrase
MKRSVRRDIPEWVGWPRFLGYFEKCEEALYPEDSRLYFVVLFCAGVRSSEAIRLTPDMFDVRSHVIRVSGVPVLKKKRATYRNFPIVRDERNPLAEYLVKYLDECETDYLLPHHARTTRDVEPRRPTTRQTIWRRIVEIAHPFFWPHSLRAWRASMLVYERGFTIQNLMEWFKWDRAEMAIHYTATRDLETAMGLKPDGSINR